MSSESVYEVARLTRKMKIDGNWDKTQWQNISPLLIENYMGPIPAFKPVVQSKMMYDEKNLYVIFHVNDRYVRCLTNKPNGPVWEDSCVEFFFSPYEKFPGKYFNLEINCGGTPLMHYNIVPRKEFIELCIEDISKIEIAHSLPDLIEPEIKEPIIWTVEYRIPISILRNHSLVNNPRKGVEWKANFFKCAEKNSNPHFITWSVVKNDKPDFHLPQFFGTLKFL